MREVNRAAMHRVTYLCCSIWLVSIARNARMLQWWNGYAHVEHKQPETISHLIQVSSTRPVPVGHFRLPLKLFTCESSTRGGAGSAFISESFEEFFLQFCYYQYQNTARKARLASFEGCACDRRRREAAGLRCTRCWESWARIRGTWKSGFREGLISIDVS